MNVDYDPFDDTCRDDPLPRYRALRQHAPVHFAPESKVYVVSRFEDVEHVLRHPELFSSDAMGGILAGRPPDDGPSRGDLRILILMDPPQHGSLRNLVNRGFTPRRIAMLEGRLREIVDETCSKIRDAERFDVVEDVGAVVPITIIAEMLGVETHRIDDFRRWSNEIIRGTTGSARSGAGLEGSAFGVAIGELFAYLGEIIERRTREPRDDLITTLIRGEGSEAGLTREEIGGFALVLLIAGNETTTNLIGSAVKLLLEHPEQLARLRTERARVPSLVEEVLRLAPPVQFLFRRAQRETTIAGTRIPENAVVVPLIASANRDERRYRQPDALDVTRKDGTHLAFGLGVHFCLGAALARLEARLVLDALLDRLPDYALASDGTERVDSYMMVGFRRLVLERRA